MREARPPRTKASRRRRANWTCALACLCFVSFYLSSGFFQSAIVFDTTSYIWQVSFGFGELRVVRRMAGWGERRLLPPGAYFGTTWILGVDRGGVGSIRGPNDTNYAEWDVPLLPYVAAAIGVTLLAWIWERRHIARIVDAPVD